MCSCSFDFPQRKKNFFPFSFVKFSVGFKEISSVTREKSIKLFSNAIRIRTRNGEQHVFACQKPREEIFIAIFRLWQNVLMNQVRFDFQRTNKLFFDEDFLFQPVDAKKLRSTILTERNSSEQSIAESDDSNRPESQKKVNKFSMIDAFLNELSSSVYFAQKNLFFDASIITKNVLFLISCAKNYFFPLEKSIRGFSFS